ncbi:MAG: double-strand break repair helicase AddA [Rhizobiaceae bacterium]
MSSSPAIPPETRVAQSEASNPSHSAWVSANAGSGKTFVLARRVIRLLLDGVVPTRILCLTFTKAAAAEMSNRIFDELGRWVRLDDEALSNQLIDYMGRKPGPREMARARTLFALSLDTPGGLKIQTIHAFCEALLHQFPLEANVAGNFQVLDEAGQAELVSEAKLRTLSALEGSGDIAGELRLAHGRLLEFASDQTLDKVINEILKKRNEFLEWTRGDALAAMADVWKHLDFDGSDDEEALMVSLSALKHITREQLQVLAEAALGDGGASNREFHAKAIALLAMAPGREALRKREALLLTQKREPRKNFVFGQVPGTHQNLVGLLEQEAVYCVQCLERLGDLEITRNSQDLFLLVQTILEHYQGLKRRQGAADFNDLITAAANLLNRSDVRSWVQYKLDQGIDHVLVDEAQDTSPQQWQIINAIIEEFHAGAGVSGRNRTVFAVGDEKQSIYSFQGADPRGFSEQRSRLRRLFEQAGKTLKPVPLNLSFRSTPDVLGAVDTVFRNPENAKGLSYSGEAVTHTAVRANDPGEVRIWPVIEAEKAEPKTEWNAPIDSLTPNEPPLVLANRIATTINGWVRDKEWLQGRGRPVRCGDILILVRKRDRFATAMIRALKELGLSIAGADRLKLTEHIASEDLMALGRVMCLPEDDLALAGLLKSPLFCVSDDELIALASNRDGQPLWDRLQNLNEDVGLDLAERCREIVARLKNWRELAATLPPHQFYAFVLGPGGARKALLARLGSEAEDILDTFEQGALSFEAKGGSLEGFLASLMRDSPEIKREIDLEQDEIRVITVHAAKGLEAPIVFLVDPCSRPFSSSHEPEFVPIGTQGIHPGYLWRSGGRNSKALADRLALVRQDAEEEYRRLLYVGMTRAADRLIVCGYKGTQAINHAHWHKMIESALRDGARSVLDDAGNVTELVWQTSPERPGGIGKPKYAIASMEKAGEAVNLPDKLPAEPSLPRPLNPSQAFRFLDESAIATSKQMAGDPQIAANERQFALERGSAIHTLLQYLPDIDLERRAATGEEWLARTYPQWPGSMRGEVLALANAILTKESLQPLFGPNSRAEAAIAGTIRHGSADLPVSGQIDRLAILDDCVLLADFKTDQHPPHSPEATNTRYLLQLALYRNLLREIYPARMVRCLLVWTANADVHEVDDQRMDAVLSRLTVK